MARKSDAIGSLTKRRSNVTSRAGLIPGDRALDNISASRYISHVQNGSSSPPLLKPQYIGDSGILFRADCLDLLANIRGSTVDLIFVDPPFNLGKPYEDAAFGDKWLNEEQYRGWCRTWLLESLRVLRPGGALFLYHMPNWLMDLGAWLNAVPGAKFRNWIALKMKSGFPIRGRLHPAHYGLLYFVKQGDTTFNVVRAKSPVCRKCGALVRDYGGYRPKYAQYEVDGVPWVQISDFWEDTRPATHDKAREQQINELPVHIAERAILMASNPGDVVLDFFAGSGSTIQAAQRNGRFWIAGDAGDVGPALARIATVFGRQESSLPAKLGTCFPKAMRRLLKDDRSHPIKRVSLITNFDETAFRFSRKSAVWPLNGERPKQSRAGRPHDAKSSRLPNKGA